MTTQRFAAEVYAGHTTDSGALVPFDPAKSHSDPEAVPKLAPGPKRRRNGDERKRR